MMNDSNLPPLLFELISEKDFKDLSPEEKQFTSTHLSKDQYNELRLFYTSTEKVFKEETSTTPDYSVKTALDKAFEKKYTRSIILKDLLLKIIDYRLPAYQVALGSLVLLLTFGWYIQSQNKPMSNDSLLAVTDTIFIEKEKPGKTDTVYIFQKEKTSSSQYKLSKDIVKKEDTSIIETQKTEPLKQHTIYITDFKNISSPGKTMKEDSIPSDFMVGVL